MLQHEIELPQQLCVRLARAFELLFFLLFLQAYKVLEGYICIRVKLAKGIELVVVSCTLGTYHNIASYLENV